MGKYIDADKKGKWQGVLSFEKDWSRMDRGWKILTFGVLKLMELPEPGSRIQKKHYKGFLVHLAIFIPIERA